MIEVQMTAEAITDLLTPGMCGMHECVKGLPHGIKLIDVKINIKTFVVSYLFDDGKPGIETISIEYANKYAKIFNFLSRHNIGN